MIRRIITALVAYIFIEFIVVGRPSYPTTSLDYFRPARCHSRHCPLTAIPFRLPARSLPLSLSSHDHETQWISLADVNDTLYRSDDSEEDGWWVVLCYISCLILLPFHPHSSSSLLLMKWWSWGRSTRCMCHGKLCWRAFSKWWLFGRCHSCRRGMQQALHAHGTFAV